MRPENLGARSLHRMPPRKKAKAEPAPKLWPESPHRAAELQHKAPPEKNHAFQSLCFSGNGVCVFVLRRNIWWPFFCKRSTSELAFVLLLANQGLQNLFAKSASGDLSGASSSQAATSATPQEQAKISQDKDGEEPISQDKDLGRERKQEGEEEGAGQDSRLQDFLAGNITDAAAVYPGLVAGLFLCCVAFRCSWLSSRCFLL